MDALFSWVGGKHLLTRQLIPLIPSHKTYIEVFAGAAWMLFRKEKSKVEIINDLNDQLINLYRCVQNHSDAMMDYLGKIPISRTEYKRLQRLNPDTLTDIQRASRFFYLLRTSYGAKLTHQTFSLSQTRPSNFNPAKVKATFGIAAKRLERVGIENQPYQKIITRYDTPDSFFYIDPPYWGCEHFYGKEFFTRNDFAQLKDLLMNLQGRFLLSLNDVPEVRELFQDFNIQTVDTNYSLGGADKKKRVSELVIMNY